MYSAITAYCLITIMQHNLKLNRSIYEILQIVGISLTDKTPLNNLFSKYKLKNIKERNGLDEPNLI